MKDQRLELLFEQFRLTDDSGLEVRKLQNPIGSVSISYIATYKLTGKEYSEKNIYFMINDEIGGKGITYDLSGVNGTTPVKAKGSRIEFQLPLHGEPYVVFEGDMFTATRTGVFVDHWEKVK